VGDQAIINQWLQAHHEPQPPHLQIHHASEVVAMDEPPGQALRFKKDSSMRVAINLVKEGKAAACVSAGNTGALMAIARFVLKTLPGIDRPAISALLPTIKENTSVRMLDLGGNVDSTAEVLYQFAVMGSVLATSGGVANPTIGLLNVGSEDIKGNEQVKQTARLLAERKSLNYVGYVEGDDIYKGVVDVVVCDGFVGNVMLKASEGLAKMMALYLKEAFKQNFFTKLIGWLARPILQTAANRLDPAKYNGASLIGLQGTVIKSHGGASIAAFINAIQEALREVQKDVPKRIGAEVAQILENPKESS
jgi:glycerol-3-phosphate acyltransferase PlsX